MGPKINRFGDKSDRLIYYFKLNLMVIKLKHASNAINYQRRCSKCPPWISTQDFHLLMRELYTHSKKPGLLDNFVQFAVVNRQDYLQVLRTLNLLSNSEYKNRKEY